MTTSRFSLLLSIAPMVLLAACDKQERTVEEEVADMRAQWDREDPPVFAPPTNEGWAYDVPSDPGAAYRLLQWERVKSDTYHAVIRRDGASGASFTRMLVDCGRQRYKVTGEGSTRAEALKDRPHQNEWTDLIAGSIKDVTVALVCRKRAT